MSEMVEDELVTTAKELVAKRFRTMAFLGGESLAVDAIEALIDAKLAVAVEAMADRVEQRWAALAPSTVVRGERK